MKTLVAMLVLLTVACGGTVVPGVETPEDAAADAPVEIEAAPADATPAPARCVEPYPIAYSCFPGGGGECTPCIGGRQCCAQ